MTRITGVLCSRFCRQVVMTDHNDEVLKARLLGCVCDILKKNIELHSSSENSNSNAELAAEKLHWGNADHIHQILQRHPDGFDLILGADIYILIYLSHFLLRFCGRQCKFILAYVSRAKTIDSLIIKEIGKHGMMVNEVSGTRSIVGNLEGVIYEVALQ
ncbi:hypothetical protein Tsubulata_007855 [Turnera subulata]|uniref:Uncharacterized protein n=1 Tax=Turnera subulata TaxID=218843 RepID=A0A9Q0GHP6_9ROSI|nr:hypothetical protein Tsubulata_007855 [Turnera subulata]